MAAELARMRPGLRRAALRDAGVPDEVAAGIDAELATLSSGSPFMSRPTTTLTPRDILPLLGRTASLSGSLLFPIETAGATIGQESAAGLGPIGRNPVSQTIAGLIGGAAVSPGGLLKPRVPKDLRAAQGLRAPGEIPWSASPLLDRTIPEMIPPSAKKVSQAAQDVVTAPAKMMMGMVPGEGGGGGRLPRGFNRGRPGSRDYIDPNLPPSEKGEIFTTDPRGIRGPGMTPEELLFQAEADALNMPDETLASQVLNPEALLPKGGGGIGPKVETVKRMVNIGRGGDRMVERDVSLVGGRYQVDSTVTPSGLDVYGHKPVWVVRDELTPLADNPNRLTVVKGGFSTKGEALAFAKQQAGDVGGGAISPGEGGGAGYTAAERGVLKAEELARKEAAALRQLRWIKEHPNDLALSEYGSRFAKVLNPEAEAPNAAQAPYATDNSRGMTQWLTEQGAERFGPQKALKPADIHALADKLKVPWDENPDFMAWSKGVTGEPRIDKMNPAQRAQLYNALQRGERPGTALPEAPGAAPATLASARTGEPITLRLYRGETSSARPQDRGTFMTPDRATAESYVYDSPSQPLTRGEQSLLATLQEKDSARMLEGRGGLAGKEGDQLLALKLRSMPPAPTKAGARMSFGDETFSNPIVVGSKKDIGPLFGVDRAMGELAFDEEVAAAARSKGHDAIIYTQGEGGKGAVVDLRYTAQVFRGTTRKGPNDPGLFGKGTYYTTSRDYAETYGPRRIIGRTQGELNPIYDPSGAIESKTITLSNPYVTTEAEMNKLVGAKINARIGSGTSTAQAKELVAQEIRSEIEAAGHDGIVIKATPGARPGTAASGDEVIDFGVKGVGAAPQAPSELADVQARLEALTSSERQANPEISRISKIFLQGKMTQLRETISPTQAMRLKYGQGWKGTPQQAWDEARKLWPDKARPQRRVSIIDGSLMDEDFFSNLDAQSGTRYTAMGDRERAWDQLLQDIQKAARERQTIQKPSANKAEIAALEARVKELTPPQGATGAAQGLPTTRMGEPRLPEPTGLPPVTGQPGVDTGAIRPRLPEPGLTGQPLTGRGGPPIPPGREGLPTYPLVDAPVTNPGPTPLRDIQRGAKGPGGLPPAGRALVADLNAPIEGTPGYQVGDFSAPGKRLMKQSTDPIHQLGDDKRVFQEIEKAKARAWAHAWWSRAKPVFGFKNGVATAVEPAPGVVAKPLSGSVFDLVEHPENYRFTPEQKAVWSEAKATLTQMVRDEQRAGVNVREHEGYWPRIVRSGPGEDWLDKLKAMVTGDRPATSGGKGHTYGRVFEQADQLDAAGFKLEMDPVIALESRLSAGIDAISVAKAKDRLMGLPGFERPSTPGRLDPLVAATETETRAALDEARANWRKQPNIPAVQQELDRAEASWELSLRARGPAAEQAGRPAYVEGEVLGLIAPKEMIAKVKKYVELPGVQRPGSAAGAVTRDTLTLLRSSLTTLDLSAGYVQGQTLFFRNNVAWWKAQAYAVVSLVKEPVGYMARDLKVILEGIDNGAISPPTEFLFTSQGIASLPRRIPVLGPLLSAANRAFEWFIFVGQTELYKAARMSGGVVKGEEELVSLGSAIRKQMGTESYAIKGVRPTQQALEALVLFAPRFMRANIGIMGQGFMGGPGGNEARKAMGALLGGGMALTIAASWATDKKMPNLDDPFAGDWLQFRIGKSYFNVFGPFYSYFRALARSGMHVAQGEPSKAASDQANFLGSKLGIAPRLAMTGADVYSKGSSRTYEGNVIDLSPGGALEFAKTQAPISIASTVRGALEGRPEEAASLTGLTVRKRQVLGGLGNQWRKAVDDYQAIPGNPVEAKAKGRLSREKYRERNPEVDARLFILGYVQSVQTKFAQFRVTALMKQHGLTTEDIPILTAKEFESKGRAGLRQGLQRTLGEPVTTEEPRQLLPVGSRR